MNPYTPSSPTSAGTGALDLRNPAKPLLVLVGGLYAGLSPMAFLSGLQAGLHIMIASVLMLILGSGTIWLAFRDFTPVCRIATILWGASLSAFFVYLLASSFESMDAAGLAFYCLVLLVVVPIPILAFARGPFVKRTDTNGN